MDKPTEDQIRQRAHELWEQSHRPDGRDEEFWNQAERELQEAEESRKPRKRNPRRHLENNKKAASSAAFLQ